MTAIGILIQKEGGRVILVSSVSDFAQFSCDSSDSWFFSEANHKILKTHEKDTKPETQLGGFGFGLSETSKHVTQTKMA